jgi:hypothetical protein
MTTEQFTTIAPLPVLAAVAAELAEAAQTAGDTSSARALNKAALYLHQGVRPEPTIGGFLLSSATRGPVVVHRISAEHGCSCEAGQNGRACWHASLIEVITTAAERKIEKPRIRVRAQPPMSREERARALADIQELF